MSIRSDPELADDSANLEWVLEQSRQEYTKHQEMMADAALDSDEESKAIDKAINASQMSPGSGKDRDQLRHQEPGASKAISNGHGVTQEGRRSPGVQLLTSTWQSATWQSAKDNGTATVSTTQEGKKRKQTSSLGSPVKAVASPGQRSLTEMFTSSPKKRKYPNELKTSGFAPLSQSTVPKNGCQGLGARRQCPPPIPVEAAEQQDSPPSSAGSDKCVTPIKFSPHPSTLTKSGDRSFGGGCHEAVAEFVDNAIEASRANEQIAIEIHLFVSSDDEKKAAIAICDQGKGMTKKDIEDFARYSYNIKERRGGERPYQTTNESRHIDGRLSVYGVGSKNAAFHLGSRLTVITRSKEAKQMSYFCMDSQRMQTSFERNEEMYMGDIIDYSPGDIDCLCGYERQDLNISNMVKRVSSDSHFTIILIGGLKKEHIAHLKKQHAAEFRKGLAHIYYFYLHGIHGHSTAAEMEDKHGLLSLKVLFYQQGKERKPFDLKQETTDTESQYQLRAKAQYDFTVDLRIVEKSGDRVYPVKGLLLYFPSTLADGETLPDKFQSHELFECFWQGRLVPQTLLPCLNFCKLREQRVVTQRDKLPDNCYKRLKGMLFFDRTMLTGHNKLNLLLPSDKLARLLDDCVHKREEKKFNDWLHKCHRDFDEEWVFCDEIGEGSSRFKTLKLSCSGHAGVLTAGDRICVKRTNPQMYGEIKYFEREREADVVFIDRHPRELYPLTDKVPVSRLDFKHCRLDDDRWQNSMLEQNRKIPVRLRVGCLKNGHCSLSDVIECTPSSSVSSEGFWITLFDGNGDPVKRLLGHKRDLVVSMKLQGPKTGYQIEGSTEGFNKFNLTETGKHTFTFTVINRASKKNSESREVVLLEWTHDIIVVADPPSAIRVVNSDSEVRLGSETFSLDVEMIDRFENPCKNVEANVALSCANKALQVVAPITTITTNESGRFLLSAIQFSPCSVKRDVIGSQHINLLVNNELKQKVNVTIKSGPPAALKLLEPLSAVEHNSVKENLVVEVMDAFNLSATVWAGEDYHVSARFLNGDVEGTTLQYSEALPTGSCSCTAVFRRLKIAFPDLKATVGQIEFVLWRRECSQGNETGREVQISRHVVRNVGLIASTRPVRLLLYDSGGNALCSDEAIPAPVTSCLFLEVEALDVRDQTVEMLADPAPYRLQTTWTGALALKDMRRGESQRLLLPPLSITEKADSIIRHSVTLIEDDEEFLAFAFYIEPQTGSAYQVIIDKQKRAAVVGCGNKGELHHLLCFFLADEFGNKVHADETTDVRAVLTNANRSECYAEGDWHLEREVVQLQMGENLTRPFTRFRLPVSAILVGCGRTNILAQVAGCDMTMTCSIQVQPGHPHRVEVCSNGFDQPQSFSDSHTLQFVWDMPLPAISAKLVDMGGSEVKRSTKSRQFTAEIVAGSRTCNKISFTTKTTDESPLRIPEGLTAEAFKIIVKSDVEEGVEPAVIKCLVRLTNRVKAIALSDVNDQVFGDEAKVVAGSQFPALVVTVETEDGLVAEIDWDDVKVTAWSPQNCSFVYQRMSVCNCSGSYLYNGDSILTEAGLYKLVVEFNDQRQELQNTYPASQLQLRSEKHVRVVSGLVDHLSVTFPEGCPNAGRPVVVYGGTEQQRTLLPVRTLVSAVDAHGNIVDDVSGRLSFKLLPESGSLNSPSCKPTATLPLEGSSLKAVLRNGETVLDSPLLLQTSKKGAAPPGSYCLHVLSTLARRSVRGVVAFTLTAKGAESVVRKLQDCRTRKQELQEETKNRKLGVAEAEIRVIQTKTKLDKLECVDTLQIADEPSIKRQIRQAQLQLAEWEKRKISYRKAVYPPNYSKYRLSDHLQSVALGRLVDLAFVEDNTRARLISSHLGDRVLSAVVFPSSENVEKYEQAPHKGCPAAVSLDVPSQAVIESIKDDLEGLGINFSWKLASDCVSVHHEGVRCLIKCLLKDTLVTNCLSSAKMLLDQCRHGNDLRAVPDILSVDGYRITGVGLVERLVDGPAESSFVFGQDRHSLSVKCQNWKKTVDLLKAMHHAMMELETKKRDYEEAVERAKPLLDQLSERIATLDKQRCSIETST